LALVLQGLAPVCAQDVLRPFDFAGVRLEDGPLRWRLDQAREFYLRIPLDDLLHGFRERKGVPAPGVVLGGWYGRDVFHVFGQIVSGLARLHAATGDDSCLRKVEALVRGFGACLEDDGYCFASRTPNAPHYEFDKLVGGLVDARRYCGLVETEPILRRITAWAEKNLARARRPGDTSTEWYTLAENLYRAFLLTGEARYHELAAVWHYDVFWDALRRHRDPFAQAPPNGYHAYSHCNTLGSAVRAFEVTGERAFLQAAIAGHDFFWQSQCFATGGYGPDEQLLPQDERRARLETTHDTSETQCGAWAAVKLCKQLLRHTGEARFGDWVERVAYNAVQASIPASPDGRVFYYADLCSTGGSKFLHPEPWTCCSGTLPQVVAEVADLVWMRRDDGLCVVLFVPASVRFEVGETQVTVEQRTAFPSDDRVEFAVRVEEPVAFALRLRVPGWLRAPMTVEVNGAAARAGVDDQRWLVLAREFADGDRVVVHVPRPLWAARLSPEQAWPAALMCGPVVLAVRSTGRSPPHGRIDVTRLDDVLQPLTGEPLTWRVEGAPDLLLRPLFAFGAGEPYFVYLDPALAHRVPHGEVTFTGAWRDAGRFRYSNVVGATASLAFEGTGIRWLGFRYDDAGVAEVSIDGAVVARVDQFGPGRDLPFTWHHAGLAPGPHTLSLRLIGDRDPRAKDCYLNVAGFDVDAK